MAVGNNLVLSVPVTFKMSFAGAREIWTSGTAKASTSAWQKMATWTVSAPAVAATSATASAGQGGAQAFTLEYKDAAGAGDLVSVWFWFHLRFQRRAGQYLLRLL